MDGKAISKAGRPRVQDACAKLKARIAGMHVGVPLPPVPELMQSLSISRATMDRAYDQLAAQGLIERIPGKGVFVADPVASGEIGILLYNSLMEGGASPAYRMACMALGRAIRGHNPRWQVRLHLGDGCATGWDSPGTLEVLRPDTLRRLRGVFTFHPLWDVEDKLEAAGVPVVVLAVDGGPHRVWFDLPAFVKGCVDHLAEAGCRRVCLLQPEHEGPTPPALRPDVVTWCGQAAAARGVAMQVVTAAFDDRGVTERTGHELFMRYWAQPKRAEGIIVCDDVLCSGVLRAMLQLGLEAPRDLRLVTHANRGVALPYHRAVTRFELDVDRLADAAVEMLARLLDGHAPVEAVRIVPLDFVKGETS